MAGWQVGTTSWVCRGVPASLLRSPGSSGSPTRLPAPPGPYRVEENVVKARGRGRRPIPAGAAPLPQPLPPRESKQYQEHEQDNANCAGHRGHRRAPCGRGAQELGPHPP